MSEAIKDRGETPIGGAEDGYVLRFTNADIRRLQQEFGTDFLAHVHPRLMTAFDWEWADKIIAAGIKKDGQPVPGMSMNHEFVQDAPIAQTFMILIDALFVSFYGATFTDHVEKVSKAIEEEIERARDAGEPHPLLTPTSTLSQSFDGGVSEPASDPTSSGRSPAPKSASTRTSRGKSASAKRGRAAS